MNYSIKFNKKQEDDLKRAWQTYLEANRGNPNCLYKTLNEFIIGNCMDAIHDYLETVT